MNDFEDTRDFAQALGKWTFRATRVRDGYQMLVVVPRSECPSWDSALERARQELGPDYNYELA